MSARVGACRYEWLPPEAARSGRQLAPSVRMRRHDWLPRLSVRIALATLQQNTLAQDRAILLRLEPLHSSDQ